MHIYLNVIYAVETDTLAIYLEEPASLQQRTQELVQSASAEHGLTVLIDKVENRLVACFIHNFAIFLGTAIKEGAYGLQMVPKGKTYSWQQFLKQPTEAEAEDDQPQIDYDALYQDLISFIEKGTDGAT